MSGRNEIITMYPVHTLPMLYLLTSSVFLTLIFGRVKADGETTSITLKCGDIKNLTSPNYPDNYNNNLEIHWDVRADLAQRILITFHDFRTEDQDSLYIIEENYPSATAKYSGNKVITPYLSLGNHLEILFRSDESVSRTGFHLSLSCLTLTDNTHIHEALEGSEHIRVLTQPVCRNAWHMDVADTICNEAGFPGAYETSWSSTTSGLNGTSYNCNTFTHRLQDCEKFTSNCTDAYKPIEIKCNVLSQLGCFNLAQHIHLLSRSVNVSRDQCLTHCKVLSTTPQYAVHHSGTNCSCINQTALDVTKLTQRDRCSTNVKSSTEHWATLFNVSFGFCSEPPELDNGSWNNTSNGFMYGTTITAKCNVSYELVGGDGKMRCDKATTSTTHDFEWHRTIPSCLKRNTVTSTIASPQTTTKMNVTIDDETPRISIGVLILIIIIIIIIIFACFIIWIKRRKEKKGESLWCLRRYQAKVHRESAGRASRTRTHSPEETSRLHSPFGIYRLSAVVENEYISVVDIVTTSDMSEYPTSINHLIRSEIPRQDHFLSMISTSFRSTENSTNDIPSINPPQTDSSVEETENTLTNDQTISALAINSSTQTLPSPQVSPRLRTLGAYVPSVFPLNLRPLPLRPISTDRTYAELGTQSDRANPCQPFNKEQSYQDPESIELTDIDVSDAAVRLPGQHLQLQVIPSDSPPTGVANTLSNGSSNVLVPHPHEEAITTVDVDGSSQTFRPLPGPDKLSDSVTSKGSPISEGSTVNHDRHDYEDADIQMDKPKPKSMTPNSPDRDGADFIRRLRQGQPLRSSSCSEKKYYSIHDPLPQNTSEEIQISQGQAPSSHDPLYFTLEREGDDKTEMIVNPLYESTEP